MHLAQLNIGRLLVDPDDPQVADFMNNIDRINALGKRMPGFVWMMEGSGAPNTGNTEAKIAGDPRFISNLTVWEDVASLQAFVYKTAHARIMERRAEWFTTLGGPHFVMWWVDDGHRPTLAEGLTKLQHLAQSGPSDAAFDWTTACA